MDHLRYLSLVLWLNVVRPTNNFIAKHNIETTNMMSLLLGAAHSNAPLDLYLDLPLLTNYIHHHLNQTSFDSLLKGSSDGLQECWFAVARSILKALNPYTSHDFAKFLFQAGQYAVLQRWSLVVETIHAKTEGADTVPDLLQQDCRFPLHQTVQSAPAFQAITSLYPGALRAMASLCESLRCRTTYHQDGTQLDELLTQDFSTALNRELNSLSAWSERFQISTETPATFLLSSDASSDSPLDNNTMIEELDKYQDEVEAATATQSTARVTEFFRVLRRLLNRPLFQLFCAKLVARADAEQSHFLTLLNEHSYWLFQIVSVYHLMDLIEVLERTQLILSHREGLAQIIQVCLVLSRTLDGLLVAVSELTTATDEQVSVSQSAFAQSVYQSLHDSWAKVFEYSLLLGESNCSMAFDVVLRLMEMEEDSQFSERLVVRSTWRQCLNALINHACDCGQLGWLCSLADMQLGTVSSSDKPTRLVDVIAQELEYLTTDCVAESYAVEKVFYFECLTTFLLVHGRFAEVVRVVDSVTTSLQSSSVYATSEDLAW